MRVRAVMSENKSVNEKNRAIDHDILGLIAPISFELNRKRQLPLTLHKNGAVRFLIVDFRSQDILIESMHDPNYG